MFVINEDNSIYVTRGDILLFSVKASNDGQPYTFKVGDVVRLSVVEKKSYDNVVLQKDFPITTETTTVEIFLEEADTKIGETISKAKDYWYEIVLNPDTNPQTIVGYDEDGAKVFKLFPESKDSGEDITEEDIPIIDSELSIFSSRPVENQAIAKAIANINNNVATLDSRVSDIKGTTDSLQEQVDSFQEQVDSATEVTSSATGNAITIDSAKAPLQNLKLFGKTTQNGTPTPDAPIPLVSVGDSGSFEVKIQGENVVEQTLTMPYTLRSIGNIKDEIDFNRGVLIQRVHHRVLKGSEIWNVVNNSFRCSLGGYAFTIANEQQVKSTVGFVDYTVLGNGGYGFTYAYDYRIAFENVNPTTHTVEQFKEYLAENPITVIGEIATPIETPLTETELNAYRQLYTNKGTTTILSECEDTEITYYVNKPYAQAIGNIHSIVNQDYLKMQGGSTL